MQNLRVRLLGDLQVEGCDATRQGRRQLRTVLKILALHHGRPVSPDRMVDCLWGDEPPPRATDQVSVLVSRLRSVLGTERIHRTDAGYALAVDWLDLDALHEYAIEADNRRPREPLEPPAPRPRRGSPLFGVPCWTMKSIRGGPGLSGQRRTWSCHD